MKLNAIRFEIEWTTEEELNKKDLKQRLYDVFEEEVHMNYDDEVDSEEEALTESTYIFFDLNKKDKYYNKILKILEECNFEIVKEEQYTFEYCLFIKEKE